MSDDDRPSVVFTKHESGAVTCRSKNMPGVKFIEIGDYLFEHSLENYHKATEQLIKTSRLYEEPKAKPEVPDSFDHDWD